jgi:hypothetical protein
MTTAPKPLPHPLFNQSGEVNAAFIDACGRVFASAHARDESHSARDRDETAADSVAAFIASISGLTRPA